MLVYCFNTLYCMLEALNIHIESFKHFIFPKNVLQGIIPGTRNLSKLDEAIDTSHTEFPRYAMENKYVISVVLVLLYEHVLSVSRSSTEMYDMHCRIRLGSAALILVYCLGIATLQWMIQTPLIMIHDHVHKAMFDKH